MTSRRLGSLVLLAALVAGTFVLATALPASAGFQTYSGPGISQPVGMAGAPNGNLWFANYGSDTIGEVDHVTGAVTSHAGVGIDGPRSVTVAPDGVVWFTSSENGRLGKIEGGVVTTFDVEMEQISDVEVDAAGDVWFNGFPSTGNLRVGRYDVGTATTWLYDVPGFVGGMTPDPTSGMWFVWFNAGFSGARIRHITPPAVDSGTPTISGFSTGAVNDPTDVTWGPDDRLWFTAEDDDVVARMNPTSGVVSVFRHPQVAVPNEIIAGPDGDLWFTSRGNARLGRIDPEQGTIVTYRDPHDTVEGPIGLAVDGGGELWYTRVQDGTNDLIGHLEFGKCAGSRITVDLALGSQPTPGHDVIQGTSAGNTINAGLGSDKVCSLGGNDKVYGGPGNDTLFPGPGNDLADAGEARDAVKGGPGDDVILGGGAADWLMGEDGDDTIVGEAGNDDLRGGPGADDFDGGAGTDACDGGLGRDTSTSCETRVGIP